MALKAWHTQFIIEYLANGENGLQAYKTVRPNSSNETAGANACRLLKEDSVTLELHRRKEEMLVVPTAELKITQEKLNNDSQTFIDMAVEDRNPNAGLKGVELQGRMNGLLDKRERESAGWQTLIQNLTINTTELPENKPKVIDLTKD